MKLLSHKSKTIILRLWNNGRCTLMYIYLISQHFSFNSNMLHKLFFFFVLIQLSSADSPTYIAGVVEYLIDQGNSSMPSYELFRRNTNKYIEIMASREAAPVDIIVFPESTLNNILTAVSVPNETDSIDLCADTSYDLNLRKISCSARKLRKYVVINLTMKRLEIDCRSENCTENWNLYNTNVVLDRDGRVVSLYRKYNLYRESSITKPSWPDLSTFTTDFNVTFGHIICFDLLFKSPAQDLVENGITNIIYTALWFSELPFLTAVQIQQSWAYANNVNFLGSGANRPNYGSGGSGIYSGKLGALSSIMTGQTTTRLLVQEIPKIPGAYFPQRPPISLGNNFDNLHLTQDQLDDYTYLPIDLTNSNKFTLCHQSEEDLCCDFDIEVINQSVPNNSVTYNYVAAVYSGVRHFDNVANGAIKTCAVFACTGNAISTCGTVFRPRTVESNLIFQKISIKGIFPKELAITMPNTLNFAISPFPASYFSYETSRNNLSRASRETHEVTMSLVKPVSSLLTFGIYAIDFL